MRIRKPRQYEKLPLCGGKRCYAHKHEAEIVKTEQELLTRDLELTIYRCTTGKHWHLTRRKK